MNLFSFLRFFLISLLLLLSIGCSGDKPRGGMPPQPVNVLKVQSADIALSFSYPATLVSEEDVVLKPKVSGAIAEKFFKAGDKVKKDQVLFLIEPEKYQASADMANASFLVANANYENMKKEHNRNQALISKQAISQKEYDTSLANYNSAKANLESARAQLQNAKIDLNYTKVSAPFDGIVGDALVNVGEYVSASSTDLVRITNLDPIYADFYISDTDKLIFDRNLESGAWQIGDISANINVDGQKIQGKLYFVDSVIDEKSGSVKAKAVFDNKDNKLLPGTFTTIKTDGFVQKNGFKIPQVAILQDQKQNVYVYTLSKENNVTKTPVSISYQDNEFVVVNSGLKQGDRVVLDNFKKIRPGIVVQEAGSK